MDVRTLENISIQELADCFNRSFSDYIVPYQTTSIQLANNLKAQNVALSLSAGAFEDGKLIGFILTGIDQAQGIHAAYNAGTGVVPERRGQRITSQLYQFLLPLWRQGGVRDCSLEVITSNTRAVKVYRSLGYDVARDLDSFKGNVEIKEVAAGYSIRPLTVMDTALWQSFWDWKPSWQNGIAAVTNIFQDLIALGAFEGERMVGYIVYNPLQKRVYQFAVCKDYRRRKVGSALFHYVAQLFGPELGVINVDYRAVDTISFLNSLGLLHFIRQHEMILSLATTD
jgi:GNAT superfamily N-acetyltransferase